MYYHVLYRYIYIKELSGCSPSRFNLHVPYFEGTCSQIIAASFWYWAERLWCFKPNHQDYIFSRSSRIDLLGWGNTPNILVSLKFPPQKNTFSQWCSTPSPKRKKPTPKATEMAISWGSRKGELAIPGPFPRSAFIAAWHDWLPGQRSDLVPGFTTFGELSHSSKKQSLHNIS